MPSRVHYGDQYNNAFWDGTKMTYGDGDGVDFGPLVSLDVAGHEMSHGVTSRSANLTYSGESGGLNESNSDIFGTMVEFYANNAGDPGDYYSLGNLSTGNTMTDNCEIAAKVDNPSQLYCKAGSSCSRARRWARGSCSAGPRRSPRRSAL